MKCPKCKKQYNGYPAISRADNQTSICPICGETEAFAQLRGIIIRHDELSEEETIIRKKIIKFHKQESYARRMMEKEQKMSEWLKSSKKVAEMGQFTRNQI